MKLEPGMKVVWFPGRENYDYREDVLDKLPGRVGMVEVLRPDNRVWVNFGDTLNGWDVDVSELKITNAVHDAKLGSIIPI